MSIVLAVRGTRQAGCLALNGGLTKWWCRKASQARARLPHSGRLTDRILRSSRETSKLEAGNGGIKTIAYCYASAALEG
jgi:hypothetical protein